MVRERMEVNKKIFSDKVTAFISISVVLLAMLAIVFGQVFVLNRNESQGDFISLKDKGHYIAAEESITTGDWKSSRESLPDVLSYTVKFDSQNFINSSNDNKVIFYDHQNYQKLNAFYFQQGKKMNLNFVEDSFIYPYLILPEEIPENLYITVESIVKNHDFKSTSLSEFTTFSNRLFSFLLFSLGIIFAMILSSITLTLLMGEKHFLLHGAFLFAAFMQQLTGTGLSRIILKVNPSTYYLWSFLSFFLMIIFTYRYLKVKETSRYLKYFYYAHIILLLGLMPFSITEFSEMLYLLTLVFAITVTLLIISTIVLKLFKEDTFPIYFFVGALMLGLSIIVLVLNQLDIIGYSIFFEYSFTYALALEGMFFTLGIFDEVHQLRRINEHYFKLAIKDQLTGLYNRYFLDVNIDKYFSRAKRYNEPLAMLLVDIDHFKYVNDDYGHDTGDAVLKEISQLIGENIRTSDLLIRWGGEEFLIILPRTGIDGSSYLAEKLRRTVENYSFETVGHLTISIGGGKWFQFEKSDEFFKKIDDALYKAKESGRNKFVMNLSYYGSMKTLENDLAWSDQYKCYQEIIDRQHKQLIDDLNGLIEKIDYSKNFENAFNKLIDQIIEHFQSEEEILYSKDYDGLIDHKEEHQRLVKELQDSKSALLEESTSKEQIIQHLIDVIIGHMLTYDYDFYYLFKNIS